MSRRFKPNQKRFAQFMFNGQIPFNPYSSNFTDLEKLQNDMSDISNQLAQPIKDNYFLGEAIKTINSIILLVGGSSVLKPYLDKLKTWLVSTNLYIKKLEQFKQIIDANKNLSKLSNKNVQPLLKNTAALKTEVPKLSLAFKALNVLFILTSLQEILKNLNEIKTLKTSKENSNDFETNKEKIENLNSKTKFEVIRLASSVASFIPGAFTVTAVIDGLLMLFNPDNLENLGFVIEGYKGGKDEAKRVWKNATEASNYKAITDEISFRNSFSPALDSITDPNVKKIIQNTVYSMKIDLNNNLDNQMKRGNPFARFDIFNKFADRVKIYNTPEDYKRYAAWVDRPGNAAIIQEIVLLFKRWSITQRKIELEKADELIRSIRNNTGKK